MVRMVWVFRFPVVSTATVALRAARDGIATDIDDVSLLAHVARPLPHERALTVRW
jgi:hypothetical protein